MSTILDFHKNLGPKITIKPSLENISAEDLTKIYTPGVAEVSKHLAEYPNDAKIYSIKKNSVAIVSDGTAVLGLGNIGPYGAIPVMEGKAFLFKTFGNVDAFPICLNTQNPEEIINIVKAIEPVFGGINLEDIAAPQCFEILARLENELSIPVFHDDQQGTAIVTLAGLINALKVKNLDLSLAFPPRDNKMEDLNNDPLSSHKIVINGAGAAGIAIARLLLLYGFKNIIVCDSQGIIMEGRDKMNDAKLSLAREINPEKVFGGLSDALKGADVFVGVSAAGALKKEMVGLMNTDPIIFALANPTPEIMPDEALDTGAYIVATGRSDFPNQMNNALVFPGLFRGVLDAGLTKITEQMCLNAAIALAECVPNPTKEKILPGLFDEGYSDKIAEAIKK